MFTRLANIPVPMKRICSYEEDIQKKSSKVRSWLVERGYKTKVLKPKIRKVNTIDFNMPLAKLAKHQVMTKDDEIF